MDKEIDDVIMKIAIESEDLEKYPDYDINRLLSLLTGIRGCKGDDCECGKY
tara:strand:+ start:13408 stop:13560 length:153 start_codon:yes stop_codon:yes gene_type:complete